MYGKLMNKFELDHITEFHEQFVCPCFKTAEYAISNEF